MKEDVSSSTVSFDSLIMSVATDCNEMRKVVTVDIPGLYLQSKLHDDEQVFIDLRGKMAELLCQTDPKKYRPHMKFCKSRKEYYIYGQLNRALYGTLQGSLRFWEDLSSYLTSLGFKRNPYDWCVMNGVIEGTQETVLFYVDDIKLSHVNEEVLLKTVKDLIARYGKVKDLTVTRGNIHEFLGVTFDFSKEKKLKIIMQDYIKEVIDEADETLMVNRREQANTPAKTTLFNINAESPALNKEDADHYHRLTAKLLYLAPRARPDLLTAVSFLCTRVQCPTQEDWMKLSRTLRYLEKTKDLILTLEVDDLCQMHCYVDAAHMLHHDLKGHTGGYTSFGRGAFLAKSKKQRLNSCSSCETELIGTGDYLKQITWARNFMLEQGYKMKPTMLYQDNESTIKLINNGRRSSSSKTKHIDNKYFYTHDKVQKGEIVVRYVPTERMWADGLSKPLQGNPFLLFRHHILNMNIEM